MDTGNRFERDSRSDIQQAQDTGVPTQGLGDEQMDNTDDQYTQQRYGQPGLLGSTQPRSDDLGQGRAGADVVRPSEPSSTTAQYGSSESMARGHTGGYSDPSTGGNWPGERDDDGTTGTGGGKPSVAGKVKGTAEKVVGKVTRDPGMQARGEERKDGSY